MPHATLSILARGKFGSISLGAFIVQRPDLFSSYCCWSVGVDELDHQEAV